ncbi:MAG: extracellular solute-binding protein [Eubacterium sp.]|jgi:raffinose/stachyose/melibiose transport system substrate-binding protein|nr:extracellular solute-binding protein [Eubacterium sp.]
MNQICRKIAAACLAGLAVCVTAACADGTETGKNLIQQNKKEEKVVNLFGPMEKSDPDAENTARTAFDQTVAMAEEKLGLTVEYRTYTAENYKEKTYDDVTLERVRAGMDDLYLLNPDTIQVLGLEGKLLDLSGLDSAKNLREIVKTANTVDGKLAAIPQEVVAHGLFINKDMFDKYHLKLPQTPEDFLECCRVFQENGIETPVGANRWWLENFVFAQAYADLYNGGNTQAEIDALNSGKSRYSSYMRPGFEFLQTLIDRGYIDAEKAYTYEAIEGEGPDFLAQKTPVVMAYWGAANTDTSYGSPDFELQVIGFPSSLGQMPVVSMTGYGICTDAKNLEAAKETLDTVLSDEALQVYCETNRVISPSKNVNVDCIPALQPLKDKIEENVYVLGSNARMKVEQWGNTCLIVRKLLQGASVDACMAEFDRLQDESLAE